MMRDWQIGWLLVVIISLQSLGSAFAQDNASRLSIVTTTNIMADVVANVAGDAADVSSMMGYGTDPHTFQATPQDIIALDDADIVFINGANFETTLISLI